MPGCTVGFADGLTGIAHRVTTDVFAADHRAGCRYVALCGAQVRPARLTAPAPLSLPGLRAGHLMAWYPLHCGYPSH
ncbi:MAG: hypothetical protein ABIZ05_00325 [Pseudonocardiaceae bacterium]